MIQEGYGQPVSASGWGELGDELVGSEAASRYREGNDNAGGKGRVLLSAAIATVGRARWVWMTKLLSSSSPSVATSAGPDPADLAPLLRTSQVLPCPRTAATSIHNGPRQVLWDLPTVWNHPRWNELT